MFLIEEKPIPVTHQHDDANFLENLLDQVNGFIFQFIFDTTDKTYTFPFVSGGIQLLYGISPNELQQDGKKAFNLVFEDDQIIMRELVFQSMKDLTPWRQDYRIQSPDKGLRWLRGNAMPKKLPGGRILWNGYISDISEVKKAELALLRNKERFEFAVQGSKMGVWDWNLKQDSVFYSDRSIQILGRSREDIEANENTWNDAVHPDDKAKYFEDINNHFKGLTQYYSNQHRVLNASGSYIWVQDRGKTIEWNEDGSPLRVIGTHEDISATKEVEQILFAKSDLIKNHNERLRNFALIVSHNLRTHAGNLQDILRMIDEADSPKEKAELSSYLSEISTGLSATVSNLDEVVLSQSKLADTLKYVSLKDYTDQIITNLQSKITEKEVTIYNQISNDVEIKYNAAYLESILHNLISNAIKYSHPDKQSEVTISVEIVSTTAVTLSITDNGLGIDLENCGSKLFGMYNTFHRNEDAKGLGLFMTKNQIEDMGDEITVESELGEGATFKVHFKDKSPLF